MASNDVGHDGEKGETKRPKDELNLAKDFYDRGLDLLVELLAARANANSMRDQVTDQAARYLDPFGLWRRYLEGVDAADLRNAVFDAARLQVDTLSDLAKMSRRFTEHVAKRLDERRARPAAASAPRAPTRQVVEFLEWDGRRQEYCAEFSLGEGVTAKETVEFPQALSLRPVAGSGDFVVGARFDPPRATLAPDKAVAVRVSVPEDPWLEQGARYQATLHLGTSSGATIQLVLKLTAR